MAVKVDGTRIRALRLERAWSQEMLAEQAGVSLRTIQRIETEGITSLQSQRAVAGCLGVAASEFSPAVAPSDSLEEAPARTEVTGVASPADRRARITLSRRARLATITSGAAVILALIGGAWFALARPGLNQTMPSAEDSLVPRIITPGYGDIEDAVAAPGSLRPTEVVPVSARVPGELRAILVDVGDFVEQGQILAQIDSESAALEVEYARLALLQLINRLPELRLNLEIAGNEVLRIDERHAGGAELGPELDQARRELLNAQTRLEDLELEIRRAEMTLARSETRLQQTEVRAPVAGTIIAIEQREGAILNADDNGPAILRMTDLSRLTVEADVFEADITRLSTETDAYFMTLGGGDRRWPASLREVRPIPATRGGSVGYAALLDVDNSAGELYPGMTVQVYFVRARAANVLTVPVSALRYPDTAAATDRANVTLLLPDGSTESREVVLGITNRASAEVVSGLTAGDRLIANPR